MLLTTYTVSVNSARSTVNLKRVEMKLSDQLSSKDKKDYSWNDERSSNDLKIRNVHCFVYVLLANTIIVGMYPKIINRSI